MTHIVHDPIESPALESFGTVARRVSLRFGRTLAAAAVRAGWADIECRMVEPSHLAGITLRAGGAGLAIALAVQGDPSRRFTYRGELAARALRHAQEFIIQTLRDHDLVERHPHEIARRCVDAHERVERIDAQIRGLADAGHRASLRRAFRRGELTQRAYQSVVHEINEGRSSRLTDLQNARLAARANVAEGISDSAIALDHALIHLRDASIRDRLDPATLHRLGSLDRSHEQQATNADTV